MLGHARSPTSSRAPTCDRHQGRHHPHAGGHGARRRLARRAAAPAGRLAAQARHRLRRPLVRALRRRHRAVRRDAGGARRRRRLGQGALRRRVELLRLADRAGRPPGSAPCPAGRRSSPTSALLAARPRHRARGRAGLPWSSASGSSPTRRSAAGCSPASTATACRPTHGLPRRGRCRWTSGPAPAGIVEAVATAAEGLATSPVAVALAWLRDRPGVSRRRSSARGRSGS